MMSELNGWADWKDSQGSKLLDQGMIKATLINRLGGQNLGPVMCRWQKVAIRVPDTIRGAESPSVVTGYIVQMYTEDDATLLAVGWGRTRHLATEDAAASYLGS